MYYYTGRWNIGFYPSCSFRLGQLFAGNETSPSDPGFKRSNFTVDGCVTPGSRSRLIFLKGSPTRITRTLVGILIRQFRPTDTITVFGPRLSEPQILDKETPASEPLKPSV